jgi:hypothetical protein
MQGKPTDRVPLHVWGVRPYDESWVNDRHESWEPLIDAVREHGDHCCGWGVPSGWFLTDSDEVEARQSVSPIDDWDLVTTTWSTPKGELTLVDQISHSDYPSLQQEFPVKTADDLEAFLSVPYVPPKPDLGGFTAYDEEIGESGVVFISLDDPVMNVHSLLGSETMAIWSVERRDAVIGLVRLFEERILEFVEYLISGGVKGVFAFLGAEYAGPPLQRPKDFREFVTEPMTKIAKVVHDAGSLVHVHCHGPMQEILEDMVELGADCLHPIEAPPLGDTPLAEAKQRVGGQVCLHGNIQVGDLFAETPDVIRGMVKAAIDDAGGGGRFILCPTASPYNPKLSPLVVDNYMAMIDTALEYGHY